MPSDEHRIRVVEYDGPTASLCAAASSTAGDCDATALGAERDVAKTIIVKLDGTFAMAVLAATERVDLEALKLATGARSAELATNEELELLFPGGAPGAVPPFGNIWSIPVYVSASLAAERRIAFHAGSDGNVMLLSFRDYEGLVRPCIAEFGRNT